ncbi:hypothetical protein DZF91_21275 [Actinomadura logoneensis]|uniref:DUF4351 domain-containing protein n=1 Tax=Actinomadura logoneensis TaxID=2293572 RepID=A0A372JIF5_9ACTN|nr:hypothetical protein [Actinomadura logoneensis]RFU39634.1 hypothetical protein DZF91_21275 [Actinomadura logoneensis]
MSTDTYKPQSDWGRRFWTEGEAHGEAKGVLAVLRSRGIAVPQEAADRITACTDQTQLMAWLNKVAHAESVEELFV